MVLWFAARARQVSPTGFDPGVRSPHTTRSITLYGGAFQPTSATWRRPAGGRTPSREPCNPTSPPAHRRRVWFGLSPFRSPLLRGSRLISLPPPTKMFPFGGFPSRAWDCQAPDATGLPVAGIPIRGSRVRRLPAPPPGISPLAAPFFGARAESSTARRRAMAPREEPAWSVLWVASAHRGKKPLTNQPQRASL